MVQIIPISERLKIRHLGILELDEFYRWFHAWFDFEGYKADETWYEERTFPNGAKYIEIHWNAVKERTKYFTYVIHTHFLLIGVSDIELGEKKIKRHRGDFEVGISSHIEMGKFVGEETPFKEFLRKIYENYIIRKRIDEYKVELYEKFYKLHNEIVAFFNQYVQ